MKPLNLDKLDKKHPQHTKTIGKNKQTWTESDAKQRQKSNMTTTQTKQQLQKPGTKWDEATLVDKI